MIRVANRAELDKLAGVVPRSPEPVAQQVGLAIPQQSDQGGLLAIQEQVGQMAAAVGRLASILEAQERNRPNALEATIERDNRGAAKRILITRVSQPQRKA